MSNLLPTNPEVSSSLGTLSVRQDLTVHSVTVYFKDWNLWDTDTFQTAISETLTQFVQPDKEIVGVKIFSGVGGK